MVLCSLWGVGGVGGVEFFFDLVVVAPWGVAHYQFAYESA